MKKVTFAAAAAILLLTGCSSSGEEISNNLGNGLDGYYGGYTTNTNGYESGYYSYENMPNYGYGSGYRYDTGIDTGYGAYNYGSDTPINYYSGDVASNGTMYNSGWATDGYRGDGLEIPYSSTDAAANY